MSQILYSPFFGDEIVLRSIDWLENFPWKQGNVPAVDNDKYEFRLNVNGFTAEEISVKTAHGCILVEASHEENDVHGHISRKLIRRYPLADECAKEDVESKLCSDGILTVTVPRKSVHKVIPVNHEGSVKAKL